MPTEDLMAQIPYQKPPQEILDILNVPAPPSLSLSPTRAHALVWESERYPPIADLAQPMIRLAGMRINPRNNGPHNQGSLRTLKLMTLPGGKIRTIDIPQGSRVSNLRWAPDGKQFAFTLSLEDRIELWLADTASARLRKVPFLTVNDTFGDAVQWLPDSKKLLCLMVPHKRKKPPQPPLVPSGPLVMESTGKQSPVRTYQDLLQNPHDEQLFEYYATSQIVLVDSDSLKISPLGKPAIYRELGPSPDGTFLLISRIQRPYSYLLPAAYFPKEVEIWNLQGKKIHTLASLPLADQIPIEGVRTGPRSYHWLPTEPATIVWAEALDDGDPRKKVSHRDKLLLHAAPFRGEPREWFRTEQRFSGLTWAEGKNAFVSDYDRDRRWKRTFLIECGDPKNEPRLVWDLSSQDRYNDPGSFVMKTLPTGHRLAHQYEGKLFLLGQGASKEGDRPFLDQMDLQSLKSNRLFHCGEKSYEQPLALLKADGSRYLTRYESLTEPPNYFSREQGSKNKTALTHFQDPAPQLRAVKKQLVRYKRPDGVELSFTLYLPPGYRKGRRLPGVIWAYPREFTDAKVAGQVSGSTYRFTTVTGTSHLFFLLQGYAVLDNATMPVVGDPETANNTFVQQIVSSAKAAIDKAEEMGVLDRQRVGIGGHSYGAFMTANLLAHSDLFKAGIARSGAYNRTLTPFGFQNERRTIWEAPDIYVKMSPFMNAEKIKEPLLLIHGEVDNNSGTFPLQSERMYHAVKGNGGTVRLVVLPHESHGYQGRESVEHTLAEMMTWFDRYVKNVKNLQNTKSAGK
ncbi:MAG: prolyl oligopeptidase family serine peptidase [Bdellovibrionales bacterium]